MNTVLRDGLDKFCTVYLDDILVFSRSEEEHQEHLRWVFGQLRAHELKVKHAKCKFGVDHIEYLGHLVTAEGVKPDPGKTAVIEKWPPPTCVREVQSFLGMANYYSQYIPQYARLAPPLTALCKKDALWEWGTTQQLAFEAIRAALCSKPVLLIPDLAPDSRFVLETDASDFALGAVL